MASVSRSLPGGSGGKILRPRRSLRPSATPYDRPSASAPASPSQTLIGSPSSSSPPPALIASGAGKVLSSVFGPESESSSDSGSGSGSGSDSSGDASASDDDIDSNDNDLGGAVELHKENLSSEIEPRTEAPINVGKVGAKHLIEKLILQETFSWEEYDKLIGIIKTRVVRSPLSLDGEGGRMSEVHDRANCGDVDMSHLCSTAVVEAKKWLQERKLGSNSELDLDNATPSVNPSWSPHVTEGETGSPVDVAKSYMSERPPWASPCFNTAGQRCASPVRMQFSKEDTLFSIGGNPLSPSKLQLKRDSPISGSWNISEEIRKVRSKATEELLRASSSKRADPGSNLRDSSMAKIDWSASGHESNRSSYLGSNLADVLGERRPGSALLVDASSDLPDPQAASQPSASAQDDLQERVLPSPPAIISEQIKDLEGDLVMTEGKGGLQDGSRDTVTVLHSGAGSTGVCDGPKDLNGFSQQDGSLKTSIPEGAQTEGSVDANGFPAPGASLSAGMEPEHENHRSYDEEIKPVEPSIPTIPHAEETCELLSETSIEVPIVNESSEIDGVATGSQNNADMQYEELSQDLTQPHEKYSGTGKRRIVSEKQEGRKQPRYSRRGRGRGKQN
ncbi:uncharacterized protein LOC104438378 [Eucalyptus grandis]|uniref:uncharacterized protein LOC104438378 n=1 Tax=Eucalyptus grandis TaxID=71139 RepID=UPI00192EF0F1|nr:uncharacterized protein LOC104438378 [Eucalyptus grandis]